MSKSSYTKFSPARNFLFLAILIISCGKEDQDSYFKISLKGTEPMK